MKLSVTPASWSKGTSRFWTRGRSVNLQTIDTALDAYDAAATIDWSSANAETALVDLENAIKAWKVAKGVKSNGKIDSCRDSKRLVSDLLAEIPVVLQAIRATPGGKQRAAAAMAASSRAQAKSEDIERESGGNWEKDHTGKYARKIYAQELDNSCTCACACTFTSYLDDMALREDKFREKYHEVVGPNNFSISGSFLPEIARTLQALDFDVEHVATGDWNDLKNRLLRATPQSPVLFAVTWNGGAGAHALICKGPGTMRWMDGGALKNHQGFLVQDPWRSHKDPLLYDDGGYWVFDTSVADWQQGFADPQFGFIWGKRSIRRGNAPKILSQGVKMPGM